MIGHGPDLLPCAGFFAGHDESGGEVTVLEDGTSGVPDWLGTAPLLL